MPDCPYKIVDIKAAVSSDGTYARVEVLSPTRGAVEIFFQGFDDHVTVTVTIERSCPLPTIITSTITLKLDDGQEVKVSLLDDKGYVQDEQFVVI